MAVSRSGRSGALIKQVKAKVKDLFIVVIICSSDFNPVHLVFSFPIHRFTVTRVTDFSPFYCSYMTPFQSFVKRSFDGVASAAGLVVLSPCFVVLCPLVKLSSPGPVFFRQPRVGRSGKTFTAFKFRTMYVGADREGPVTTADDPRITPLGRFLRKFKLDELPQLWNVLLGRMSFVGPRPDVPGYADWLAGDDRTILDLRPGITGPATLYFRYEGELLAKVSGPKQFNDTVLWPIKVRMNLEYLRKWGFWKDIGYILITVLPPLNRWLKLVPDSPRELKKLLSR